MSKIISADEYGAAKGIKPRSVRRFIERNNFLDFVLSIKRGESTGRPYLLEVPDDFSERYFEKRICIKCRHPKEEHEFRLVKNGRDEPYKMNTCRDCEKQELKEYRKKRMQDFEYVLKRREAVRKYRTTEKGKLSNKNKKRNEEKRKQWYQKTENKRKEQGRQRAKKRVAEISDEYCIIQLMHPNRKDKITWQEAKNHPELIEQERVAILQRRLKLKIEEAVGIGICTRCKKITPVSEFLKAKGEGGKYDVTLRVCKKCQRKNSKHCWDLYKKKKMQNNE